MAKVTHVLRRAGIEAGTIKVIAAVLLEPSASLPIMRPINLLEAPTRGCALRHDVPFLARGGEDREDEEGKPPGEHVVRFVRERFEFTCSKQARYPLRSIQPPRAFLMMIDDQIIIGSLMRILESYGKSFSQRWIIDERP